MRDGKPVAISQPQFEACCCFPPEDLYIEYRWAPPSRDLDTGTTFIGVTVGWACGGYSSYLHWHGDNTGYGPEIIEVNVVKALTDGLWSDSVQIQCAAGWYSPAGGSGPAILYAYFNGVPKQKTVNPGSQTSCASTPVGTITVYEDGTFDLV